MTRRSVSRPAAKKAASAPKAPAVARSAAPGRAPAPRTAKTVAPVASVAGTDNQPSTITTLAQWAGPPGVAGNPTFRALLFVLNSLANVMHGNQEHFARYIGVTVPRFMMMVMLETEPLSTVSRLAARLEVSSQFVTVEIGKLIEQGLVEKLPNEQDRRSVLLDLTELGRRLLDELTPLRQQTNDRMFRSLSAEQATQLQASLDQLLSDGREALHQLETPNWRERRAPSLRLLADK